MIRAPFAKRSHESSKPAEPQNLLRPLSAWFVVLAVVVVAAVAWPLTQWLYTIAGDDPARKIDAVRTGLSVAAGTGGVFALLLAFRRQRATELIAEQTRLSSDREHEQRERKAKSDEDDARSRRVTDQYAKAAEQLSSQNAAARLAGLYALERIGATEISQRQAVINLICAYLRIPYAAANTVNNDQQAIVSSQARVTEEMEVRVAAQDIICKRTREVSYSSATDSTFWSGMSVDLSRAVLVNINLLSCRLASLTLQDCTVYGPATFARLKVDGDATIRGSVFHGPVDIVESYFYGTAHLGANKFQSTLKAHRVALFKYATMQDNSYCKKPSIQFATRPVNSPMINDPGWPDDCIIDETTCAARGWILISSYNNIPPTLKAWSQSLPDNTGPT